MNYIATATIESGPDVPIANADTLEEAQFLAREFVANQDPDKDPCPVELHYFKRQGNGYYARVSSEPAL